jgi:hypothetical protein
MAQQMIQGFTPSNTKGCSVIFGDYAKAVAHSPTHKKTGYVTISRYSASKSTENILHHTSFMCILHFD